jgi:hypothetical protein
MTGQEEPEPSSSEPEMIGDPIPDVFPPHEADARFVVAMAMARNDIDRALRDLLRAVEHDSPDFTYRVRLITGHLVEAIESLKLYRDRFVEVRKLLECVSTEGREYLTTVSGTMQKAGKGALDDVRINTFHYPSPDPKYKPTSDEKLRDVLALMSDQGVSFHVDGDTLATTMSFADDVALDLAMGRTANLTVEEALRRSEIARDGALAFHSWFDRLIKAYIKTRKLDVGEPIWSEKPNPAQGT